MNDRSFPVPNYLGLSQFPTNPPPPVNPYTDMDVTSARVMVNVRAYVEGFV